MRATLDTGRRIADDVVEILRQFGQHAFDAGLAQRLLVSRLAGGEDVQVLVGLVLDQCLPQVRSEEHTSELQSLMRTSYAVFCLKKKTHTTNHTSTTLHDQPHKLLPTKQAQHKY